VEVLNANAWAAQQFGETDLGDVRRTRRLVEIGAAIATSPGGTLSATLTEWSVQKRGYELFSRDDVTHGSVMEPHIEATCETLREPGEYVVIEDTSSVHFVTHLSMKDMGWVDSGQQGLHVHSALAMRVEGWQEDGTPSVSIIGLAGQQVWSRVGKPKNRGEKRGQRRHRPRESQRWAKVVTDTERPPEGVRRTFVADRESDIFEVFVRCQSEGWDYIVRSKEPRSLFDEKGSIRDAVARADLLGTKCIRLRAVSATLGRKAMPARDATLEVRSVMVTVKCPVDRRPQLAPVTMNIVEVREVGALAGVDPLHWILLTTWECASLDAAWRVVQAYGARWIIEEFHKALKTGTGIEKAQLSTRHAIEALLGVLSIVAVRLTNLKLLAKVQPDAPLPEDALGPEYVEIIEARYGKPTTGWTYASVLIAIARLGGFLARKSDGMPGWITIWRGWTRMEAMVEGANLVRRNRRHVKRSG